MFQGLMAILELFVCVDDLVYHGQGISLDHTIRYDTIFIFKFPQVAYKQ